MVVGSVGLFSATKTPFTSHDKAYYLNEATVEFHSPRPQYHYKVG